MTPRVAGRFELVELAARGGMGEIWRALDTVTGRQVALKRALAQGVDHDRFRREAQLLATVRHPAMVAHVAHGEDDSGVWLAMSWLEGETLAARIERRALPLTDVLQVARGLAGGLAALHHLGVVHRDVKPANIMLVDGDPARAVLLDLGIARGGASGRALTATNVLLGTLGYMAPEQAQSGRDVDARADVFALGCVLFECLTGEPAFPGDHPVAVLAQMFSRTPPRLCALRPELPPTLDALVAAMTARDPELRPRDGAAVGEALAGIGALGDVVLDSAPRRSTRITRSEQHFAVAVFAEVGGGGDVQVTVDVGIAGSRIEQLRRLVRELGSDVVVLHSTGALIALGDRGTAVDRAHLAATMARAIVEAMPDARLGISAGLVPRRGNLPAGALLERAVDMARGTDAGTIAVDPTVSELLRTRFTVQSSRERLVLGALVPTSEELRVCGHSTPFVGRDKELALLEATVSESIEECSSRAVVVLAPPGLGKSRLGRELRRRLRARGDVELFGVQAEFARAGVVNHSLRQLLRSALNVGDAPAGGLETTLRDYLRRLPGLAAPERVGDFLAALLGATPAAPGSELAASLGEPEWMARWTRRSLREWLGAASSARPIVLLFEDLHWCDDASLGHLVDALRTLRGAPVTFVAFARPEAAERLGAHPLPGLQELRLAPLGARAAERIVRAVLGDTADAARLVALAAGNPFYLEELLRFVIDALGEELPASVSALLHARIADLDPALRRFVRAASVLGERIAPAALAAVTGASDDEVGSALAALATHEMLDERDGAWWFRHALLRETAYATLDAADASAAHGLAADWLERQGDRDPREILEHLERARADERICAYCLAAASRAQEAAADWLLLELAERGLRASPSPLERGRLCALRSSALSWQDRLVESLPDGLFALQTLPHDDPLWIHTLGTFIFAAAAVGDHEALAVGVRSSLAAPRFAATRIANIALFGAVNALDVIGMRQAARELFTRAELPAPGTPAMAIRRVVEAEFAAFQDARFGSCYALAHEALAIARGPRVVRARDRVRDGPAGVVVALPGQRDADRGAAARARRQSAADQRRLARAVRGVGEAVGPRGARPARADPCDPRRIARRDGADVPRLRRPRRGRARSRGRGARACSVGHGALRAHCSPGPPGAPAR